MKGVQYRLIIYVLVFLLGILMAYSLMGSNDAGSCRANLDSCVNEKEALYEQRIDPDIKNELQECENMSNALSYALGSLKSNFTEYCGMFGTIPTSGKIDALSSKVEKVKFRTSMDFIDIPFGGPAFDYCSLKFKELMKGDSFYSSGENYKCAGVSIDRTGYTLNIDCVCGYYPNPTTKVILPP
ncbi:MAG: hypothetical protein JXB14_00295 [Candidatus Altiarchaeota archaeon]|nr:hypothetical protein [Candidatus Altiarchaeota archaeon]